MLKNKLNKFSVPLGLLDYINPILYSITMMTIINNVYENMFYTDKFVFLLGAIISIIFGLVIPTGKVIVGFGLIKFRMPVSLVFTVNSGILLSGLMLLKYILNFNIIVLLSISLIILILLSLLYKQSKKFNTIAVLTGACGYLMIYISLIIFAINNKVILPVILYALAIFLFIILCGIGIKANLKDPKVHWLIESFNILCQFFVALATIIVF